MAKARNWQALSPSYRARLERGGVSRSAYESGASVSAARGHARTPERPAQALRQPARFPEYTTKRTVKSTTKDADRLRRELKKIGNRYGIHDILSAVPPSERAEFIAGWQIAHAEYERYGSSGGSYARQRLDALESDNPNYEKALGYYH